LQKKILIINSHPDDNSFNYALSERYAIGAKKSGADIKIINLYKLDFKPFFRGIEHENIIEEDIKESQRYLKWADHIVFFYPIWWATIPALLKSFLERALVPGFSYENNQTDKEFLQWHELLSGKTARIVVTMDSPPLFHIIKVKQP
jgi:putative NADPH-quinone reductase